MTETYPWAWYSDPAVLRRERERIFRSGVALRRPRRVGCRSRRRYFACTTGGLPVGRHPRPRAVSCARSSTSAATAARRSPPARAAGRRSSARTTPGHTDSTDGCARHRAAARGRSRRASSLVTAPARGVGAVPVRQRRSRRRRRPRSTSELPVRPGRRCVFRERVDYSLAANWKIAVENYLECYHCPVAHPGFSRLVDVDPGLRTASKATATIWSQYGQRAGRRRAAASSTSSGPV